MTKQSLSSSCYCYFKSSIGKKQVLGLSAAFLCLFSLVHFIGNLLMFCGPRYFNLYSHALISNPLIYGAELILGLIFVTHIIMAIKVFLENKFARPKGYYMKVRSGRGATIFSSTMPYTGMIILLFLIFHLANFKYGTYYYATYDGVEVRDLYKLMLIFFQNPSYVAGYVVAMILFCFHLNHGVQSIFQSWGVNHPKYTPWIKRFGFLYASLMGVGFSSFPIWAYITGKMVTP